MSYLAHTFSRKVVETENHFRLIVNAKTSWMCFTTQEVKKNPFKMSSSTESKRVQFTGKWMRPSLLGEIHLSDLPRL